MTEQFLKVNQVLKMSGDPTRATLGRWVKAGLFPAPYKIGPQRIAWKLSEVQAWIDSKEVSEEAVA